MPPFLLFLQHIADNRIASDDLEQHARDSEAEILKGGEKALGSQPFEECADRLIEQNHAAEARDTLRKCAAAYPAAKAKSVDLTRIGVSMAAAGMPKSRWLATGETTAVRSPALHPYLYAPTSVKK